MGDTIDGKAFAADLRAKLGGQVAALKSAGGPAPGLAVVLVGADPASQVYVRHKVQATLEAGMQSFRTDLPADTPQSALLDLIARLNADDAVDGILVQLPLPPQIDADKVLLAIDPAKDVDGFHPINVGRLNAGMPALAPCTPTGCMMLLKDRLGELS